MTTFTSEDRENAGKLVAEAPYHPGYEDAAPGRMKPSLFLATPMYGGMCNGQYAVGLLRSVNVFAKAGVAMQFSYMMNESLITRARNTLAHDFLQTDCTHLMFIDADIGFDPTHIIKMIEADKDIICGIYPKKEINWGKVEQAVKHGVPASQLHAYTGAFVVNLVNDVTEQEGIIGQPMQISNGGTGFMLIKRQVFEGLMGQVPIYINDMYQAVDQVREAKIIHEFFATSIDAESGNRLLSEDYHFCKIARKAGFTVWAAPWASLIHAGTYNFSGQIETL